MGTIKLVIFDMAGTVIDHGCMAPVAAFIEAFRQMGITVSIAQARAPMGLHKRDHIREILRQQPIAKQWLDRRGSPWSEENVQAIYESFLPHQAEVARRHADIVPGLRECLSALRREKIAIATTTGYPREVAGPAIEIARQQGLEMDASVCADEVSAGRPAPWMIFRCMELLEIFPPSSAAKIGDTVPDMQAGRNAGCWAVGVTETGSELGLSHEELEALEPEERKRRSDAAGKRLSDAGAHHVIRSVAELPEALRSGRFDS